MEEGINKDTWFVFSVFFLSALALFILFYTAIPYFTRKKHFERSKNRRGRIIDNYSQFEKKRTDRKVTALSNDKEKLKIDLIKDLKESLQSKTEAPDMLSFFSNFEKIYPDFTNSLQDLAPNITAKELKFCALLRLNLSSKEISQLLHITPESVNKARYRLRKKLNLNAKDDLFIFISSL